MGVFLKQMCVSHQIKRTFCVARAKYYSCKLLIVGGGAGGCSIAWRFANKLKPKDIIVLEPSGIHYYQPHFTLVSAGIKPFKESCKQTGSLLPNVVWLKERAESFDPANNTVHISGGEIKYDFMVVALGLKNDYDKIMGLKSALNNTQAPVTTIYSAQYCQKTWLLLQQFSGGLAVFTRPKQAGKCSGAALCAIYLADDYWRKQNIRSRTSMMFATGDDVIYSVPKYACALCSVAAQKDIAVNYDLDLVEVNRREAVFTDSRGGCLTLPYNFLHVTPPMSPPSCLAQSELAVEGYLDVDRHTLRHKTFGNVFGVGDCLCTPNSKSAAAVAQQSPIVESNLWSVMQGREPTAKYNGYGACPILTSYRTAMLAEFVYGKRVTETFPFDQSKESRLLYKLKKDVIPYIYWNKLIKGKWGGPASLRRIINPFGK